MWAKLLLPFFGMSIQENVKTHFCGNLKKNEKRRPTVEQNTGRHCRRRPHPWSFYSSFPIMSCPSYSSPADFSHPISYWDIVES